MRASRYSTPAATRSGRWTRVLWETEWRPGVPWKVTSVCGSAGKRRLLVRTEAVNSMSGGADSGDSSAVAG